MAASNALLTLDEAKLHLGIASTDSSSDEQLIDLIDAASNQIERYCKTCFIQRTISEEAHDGSKKIIFLMKYPVVSITTFVDAAGNTVPSADYFLEKEIGRLTHWGRFPRPSTTYGLTAKWLITYVSGWFASIEYVAADIKLACKRLVALDFESPTGGVDSVSVGSLSISYSATSADGITGAMPASVAGPLSTYRRNVTP